MEKIKTKPVHKPEIITVFKDSCERLNEAYSELDDILINLCSKYHLNYYELYGIIESIKLNYDRELQEQHGI